jgi:MFS family permease
MINYVDRGKTAVLLPLIVISLSMTKEQTGWVMFAFFICYAGVQPLAGFVTDLLGPKKTLALSVGAFSIFTWTMALVNTWEELLVRNALFGIAQGFEMTAGARLVATWFPTRVRGRAAAFHQTAFCIGSMSMPFIAVPLARALGSWRWSFMIVAFFGLPVLAAIHHFVADRPERDTKITEDELKFIFGAEELANKQGAVLDPTKARSTADLPPGERVTAYREIFLNPSVFLMALSGFFELIISWGMGTWLPTYGVQQLKLPLLLAGSLVSSFSGGQFCGVVAGGILSDMAFGLKRTPIWLLGGPALALVILWAASLKQGAPLWEVYTAFFLSGFFVSWSVCGQLFAPYLAELLTPGAVGRSLGIVVLVAMIGSAVAQPLTAKLIIKTPAGFQFWPVFMMFAVSALLMSLCVVGMKEPRVGRPYLTYLLSGRKTNAQAMASVR